MTTTRLLDSLPAWLWMLPLLLLVAGLGALPLNDDIMWFDEAYTAYVAGGVAPLTLEEALGRIYLGSIERHPPGYYLVTWVWINLGGSTEFSLRIPAYFAGMLAAAAMFAAGRHMTHSVLGGLAAAAALSGSALFIHYMHEARMYTWLLMSGALVIWSYWGLLDSRRLRPGLVITLFLGLTTGALAFYAFGVLCLLVGLYHLLFEHSRPHGRALLAVFGLAGLVCLPIYLYGILIADTMLTWSRPALQLPDLFEQSVTLFTSGAPALLVMTTCAALLVMPVRQVAFIGGIAALYLLINGWMATRTGYFHVRAVLPVILFYALSTAWGMVGLVRLRAGIAVIVLVSWIVAAVVFGSTSPGIADAGALTEDFDALIRYRSHCSLADDDLLVFSLLPFDFALPLNAYYAVQQPDDTEALQALASQPDRVSSRLSSTSLVWLLVGIRFWNEQNVLPPFLERLKEMGFRQCPATLARDSLYLYAFAAPGSEAVCPQMQLVSAASTPCAQAAFALSSTEADAFGWLP